MGMACCDQLVSIRKTTIVALSVAFMKFSDINIITKWLHSGPRLIANSETSIQGCDNSFMELVLKQCTSNLYAANGLGMILVEKGQLNVSKEMFTRVQEAVSGTTFLQMLEVWINLEHVYFAQGNFTLAEKRYQNCLWNSFHNTVNQVLLSLARPVSLAKEARRTAEAQKQLPLETRKQENECFGFLHGAMPFESLTLAGDDGKERDVMVCQGKESYREWIKSFLAVFLMREMQADMIKGVMASTPLHHHYTVQPLPSSAEYVAFKQAMVRLIFYPRGQSVAAYIPSWLQGPAAAISRRPNRILARKLVKRRNVATIQNHVHWEGLNEVQNATILTLSLEDKALKGVH